MAKRSAKFEPFWVYDIFGYLRHYWLVCETDPDGFRLVRPTPFGYFQAVELGKAQIGARYARSDVYPSERLGRFKADMLKYGATPEAIRLFGLVSPLKKQEETTMAEKLKGKGGDAKPAAKKEAKTPSKTERAEALKTAAKAAPAAKPEKPKGGKGNIEALQKANAARKEAGAAPDKRKITINTEGKKNPYRDGTKAAATFDLMKRSKTVDDFKQGLTEQHDAGYLRYASRDGHITLG